MRNRAEPFWFLLKEYFIFSDGMKPTKKQSSDVFAVNFDRTISYFRIVGRIAIDSNETKIKGKEVLKVNFEKYIEGYVILDIR